MSICVAGVRGAKWPVIAPGSSSLKKEKEVETSRLGFFELEEGVDVGGGGRLNRVSRG